MEVLRGRLCSLFSILLQNEGEIEIKLAYGLRKEKNLIFWTFINISELSLDAAEKQM